MKKTFLIFVLLLLIHNNLQAYSLSGKGPSWLDYISMYINKATLVIEPRGLYAEQTLYLEYSERGQATYDHDYYIQHRFLLPKGTIVSDMWLWIGDSVMKAEVMDAEIAMKIFRGTFNPSIQGNSDYAIVAKYSGETHIYINPIRKGLTRKVKITFLTPIERIGDYGNIHIPFDVIYNYDTKPRPLTILVKNKDGIDYKPQLLERPGLIFEPFVDTLGYTYQKLYVTDFSNDKKLTIKHQLYPNDIYYRSGKGKDDLEYFQLSVKLNDLFGQKSITPNQKVLIGLDLSGPFYKDFNTLIPGVADVLNNHLKQGDEFNIIVSGAGRTKKLSDTWIPYSQERVNATLSSFRRSTFADSIKSELKRIYVVGETNFGRTPIEKWNFSFLKEISLLSHFVTFENAFSNLPGADIIAIDYFPGTQELQMYGSKLDSFILNGGTLLCLNSEYANRYLNDHISAKTYVNTNLYPNKSGVIGSGFPDSLNNIETFLYEWNGNIPQIELKDNNNDASVVSVKVGQGTIILSGIIKQYDSLREIINGAHLGLKSFKRNPDQIKELFENIKLEYQSNPFDCALVMSNSDTTLQNISEATHWVNNYINQYGFKKPVVNTINLVKHSFNTTTTPNYKYPGSGYVQSILSQAFNGFHYETNILGLNEIARILNYGMPAVANYNIIALGDNDSSKIIDYREIVINLDSVFFPKHFFGSTNATNNLTFTINAKFYGIDSSYSKTINFPISSNEVKDDVVPAIIGNDKINEIMNKTPIDTNSVINNSFKYNVLSEFAYLVALPPTDTTDYLKNYLDESLLNIEDDDEIDSLIVSAYPNPFNAETKIMVNVKEPSRVSISVYNILGELVSRVTENEELTGKKLFSWNGKAEGNLNTASGIYFTRIEIVNSSTNQKKVKTIKLMMLK